MRKLALAHLTIEEATPAGVVMAAAAAGFPAVGLRITGFSPDDAGPQIIGDVHAIRDLRHRLQGEGMQVVTVSAYRLTPSVRASDYGPVFETCAEIGARTMLATCFIPDHGRAAALLADIYQEASKVGLRIGLEFFRSSELKSLAAAEHLRQQAACENIGHIIDALHLWRAGDTPLDVAQLDARLIYGVQLCDGPMKGPSDSGLRAEIRDRLFPGEGELPLFNLLDAVPQDITVELEVPRRALVELSPLERARRAYEAGRDYLEAYARQRDRQAASPAGRV